jgi:hypothetical protein
VPDASAMESKRNPTVSGAKVNEILRGSDRRVIASPLISLIWKFDLSHIFAMETFEK